jgi:import inner membrane translocase subunit TIM21
LKTLPSTTLLISRAFEIVRGHYEIVRIYGEPIKGYGRDHGGHREGRRNFIENTAYDEPSDGSKRTRVRFNIKGAYSEGEGCCRSPVR